MLFYVPQKKVSHTGLAVWVNNDSFNQSQVIFPINVTQISN